MKIINKKIIDTKLILGINIIEKELKCKIDTAYCYKIQDKEGYISTFDVYYNKIENKIYIDITKNINYKIYDIGLIEIIKNNSEIKINKNNVKQEYIDFYRDIIKEISIKIFDKEQK